MRFIFTILIALIIVGMIAPASAGDPETALTASIPHTNLYHVLVRNQQEADALSATGGDPIFKTDDGYLVLAPVMTEEHMIRRGLIVGMIATDITRREIAMDMRRDNLNRDRYDLLYGAGGLRFYRIDPEIFADGAQALGFVPIRSRSVPILYHPQPVYTSLPTVDLVDLETLATSVRQDSLESYLYHLESYGGRMAGSTEIQACAAWLVSKFEDFGYDSIVVEVYWDSVYGEWADIRNVVAYKIGSLYPDVHVVYGAHYDAVPGSPGADDNGSGTAAVLEMARAMIDIDTRVTYIFALWDAEEEGLLGSWHYANHAYVNSERIILNINLDMIGFRDNDSDALVCTSSGDYEQLMMDLSDSLASINLVYHTYYGESSDHVPFKIAGYDYMDLFEYIFSTVYHSPLDNTDHINFDYMTRVTRSAIVIGYVIGENYIPPPELIMSAPDGLPEIMLPEVPTPVEIYVDEFSGAVLTPGSVTMHYSINEGEWLSGSMNALGGGLYSHTFPPLQCVERVDYFVSVEEASQGICYYPDSSTPAMAIAATDKTIIFQDDFSTDLGWEAGGDATFGLWERDRLRGSVISGEPIQDIDGSRFCYLTDNNYGVDVDKGSTWLETPPFDADDGYLLIHYARWYSNCTGTAPFSDIFYTYISNNDGLTWHMVDSAGPVDQADGGWSIIDFFVNDIIEPTEAVRLRFVASDLGDDSQVEAAIDDFKVYRYGFNPAIIAKQLPHWTLGHPYSQQLEAATCSDSLFWIDRFGHLEGSGLSLLPTGLVAGTPMEEGLVLFVAKVTDGEGLIDESMFSFMINPALVITTDHLPAGKVGIEYSCQLKASGGTGMKTWQAIGGSLAQVGLELGSDGLLSGTPSDTGIINVEISVEDEVGAYVETAFMLHIDFDYICGDANGDEAINVGDAVFLIAYVFNGGSAPEPLESGDANWDGQANVGDAVYLINYVFKGGPEPCCP